MINALLGVGAAIGIGLTVFHQPIYSVAVFGVWAFGAGLLQLVLGLIRRKQLGGGDVYKRQFRKRSRRLHGRLNTACTSAI